MRKVEGMQLVIMSNGCTFKIRSGQKKRITFSNKDYFKNKLWSRKEEVTEEEELEAPKTLLKDKE